MADEAEDRTCRRCRFWCEIPNTLSDAAFWRGCVRYPPTVQGDENRGTWLETHCQDWCGEFVPVSVDSPA